MKVKIILFVLTSFLLATCTNDVYNPDVCFQENILPIFITKCSTSGCHNASNHASGYNFSNYEGIMKGVKPNHPYQSEIFNAIRGNNPSMPVGQKLDQKEVTYIKLWIKMGAQNTSNCSSCDTSNYTYSGKIKPLITTWCVGCHNPTNAGGNYDFSTYNGVVSSITSNRLLGTLNHVSGYSPMPKNASKLIDCDINAIQKWINAGYPNN